MRRRTCRGSSEEAQLGGKEHLKRMLLRPPLEEVKEHYELDHFQRGNPRLATNLIGVKSISSTLIFFQEPVRNLRQILKAVSFMAVNRSN